MAMAKKAAIGSEIGNKSGALGQGTLCCFLKKAGDSNPYLLSCWHVLKDNINWGQKVMQPVIVDNKGNAIGSIVTGQLTGSIDVGIAKYTLPAVGVNSKITITGQPRMVTANDAQVSTPVKLFGKVCKLKQAVIFHDSITAKLVYPDGLTHSILDTFSVVVKDTDTGNFVAPTSDGDSGAVVTDINGIPLGMVIGGDGQLSYALKFTNIFKAGSPYAAYSFLTNT